MNKLLLLEPLQHLDKKLRGCQEGEAGIFDDSCI